MAKAKSTIEHETIKNWVEERGGRPAHVKSTGSKTDPGLLRIDYTGASPQKRLERIPWKAFFKAFEENQLAFLYQEDSDSRFSKLVSRDAVEVDSPKKANGKSAQTGGKGAEPNGKSTKSNGKSSKASGKSSKASGKSTQATRGNGAPRTDAIELLKSQHREVEELFEKIEKAKSATRKEHIFTEIANALAAHAKLEETIFYPAAFSEETEEELREAVEEHLMAKRLIYDLMKMKGDDPQYMSKVTVLKEAIEHHVEEEESTLFPSVRKHTEDDLGVLGAHMERRYRQLLKEKVSQRIPKEVRAAVVSF